MIQIKDLTIIHNKDLRTILSNFNLVLNDGDKAVIIGEEGNGKSTLLKWLYNPQLIDSYCQYQGQRIVQNHKLAYLGQELSQEDGAKTIYEYFLQFTSFLEQTTNQLAKLAITFEMKTDIFYSNQLMESLSGGERIKIQLMALLMTEPDVLLLDEPSNDIDLQTLLTLQDVINDFPHIVLFISHDEVLIENTANVIVHLEQIIRKTTPRYTVVRDDYKSYINQRLNIFEKQRQLAVADKREKALRDQRYQKILQSVQHKLNTVSRQDPSTAKNLKDKMHTVKSIGKRFEKEDKKMTAMPQQEEAIFLTLNNENNNIAAGKIVLDYQLDKLVSQDGKTILAKNIKLFIKGPRKVCIIGKNGIGKTTLLKNILKHLSETSNLKIAYMPQNYQELLNMDITPVAYLADDGQKETTTWVRTCLGSMKYTTDEMEHPIKELSGGQKAKLFLLKMSLSNASVLVLDEPTRNFSPLSAPVIRKLIKEFSGTVISVSHDRKYIYEVADEVYELKTDGLHLIS